MRAFRNPAEMLLLLECQISGELPAGLARGAPTYTEALARLRTKGLIKPADDENGIPRPTAQGKALLERLVNTAIPKLVQHEEHRAGLFEVWLKFSQALEGLLMVGHEQVEEMVAILSNPERTPFKPEETAMRLYNDQRLSQILWDLYCYNSETGTNNEQDLRLLALGFKLFNQPKDPDTITLDDPHKLGSRLSKILRMVTHTTGYSDNPLLWAIKEACWGR